MAQYQITIVNGDGAGVNNKTSPAKKKNAAPQSGSGSSGADGGIDKAVLKKGIAAFDIAKGLVFTITDFGVNTVETRTGSQALQARYQFYNNVAKRSVNLLESIGVGFAIGNAPGAIIGAMSSIVSTGISMIQSSQAIALERTVESGSIRLSNIRAGGAPRGGANG